MTVDCGRCTGHCCSGFTLPYPHTYFIEAAWFALEYEVLPLIVSHARQAHDIAHAHNKHRIIVDGVFIAHMIVPVQAEEARTKYINPIQADLHFFKCRHLKNGNCSVYEQRPNMCRNFPYGSPCPFKGCTWKEAAASTVRNNG